MDPISAHALQDFLVKIVSIILTNVLATLAKTEVPVWTSSTNISVYVAVDSQGLTVKKISMIVLTTPVLTVVPVTTWKMGFIVSALQDFMVNTALSTLMNANPLHV